MDWNRVEGNWKQVKGKVKEKWGKLTGRIALARKSDRRPGFLAKGWFLRIFVPARLPAFIQCRGLAVS
jgi:hypothetical protein